MTTVAQRLGLGLPPADITEQGSCARTDPDAFYPEGRGASAREAKRVCRRCPVVDQCLQWAMDTDERFGVWGGTSERDRRKLRRARDADKVRDWPCPEDECDGSYDTRQALASHRYQRHPSDPAGATA